MAAETGAKRAIAELYPRAKLAILAIIGHG